MNNILKIVFWRNSGSSEDVPFKDGDAYTHWTENHHLIEETAKELIADDDVCEIRVVNGLDMLVFYWDDENGTMITSKLLEVA
jgi:hypothetical protein